MVNDLIYDCEPFKEIQGTFPSARLERCYDDVHGCRISVEIESATDDEWYEFLIRSGWYGCSLNFQLSMADPEKMKKIKAALARVKETDGEKQPS